MNISFIGLGSNLGNKIENITKSIYLLNKSGIIIEKISSLYQTPPVGYEDQDYFINAVIKIKTDLEVINLLKLLQKIEKEVGREKTFKWGPRVIDLDILFYNQEIIENENLIIPHPFLHKRAFVLVPFVELEKDFIHPVYKKNINFFYKQLPQSELKNIKNIGRLENEIFH